MVCLGGSAALWPSPARAVEEAEPTVAAVGILTVTGDKTTLTPTAGLGDRVTVRVQGLRDVHALNQASLYIDGRRLDGLVAIPDYAEPSVQFDLAYNPKNSSEWNALFGQKGWKRPVVLTIGVADGRRLRVAQSGSNLTLVVIHEWLFVTGFAVFLGLLVFVAVCAVKTDILRDMGPQPGVGPDPNQPPRKPFSLGRCQMAWWLFVVLASYLFIGIVTGNWEATVTGAAMALMGISAATAVGAVSIDVSKRSDADSTRSALLAEQATLQARHTAVVNELAQLTATLTAIPSPSNAMALAQTQTERQSERSTILSRLRQIKDELQRAEAALGSERSTGNVITDILSDAEGIALHRFQIAAWTLVLGLVFLYSVYRTLAMPQFSAELLVLMGISGGAYLGFKYPERPA
jgi:hypothetical protein